jgi:hypothetical protein
MPSRTNTTTATAAPAGKKFELPALEFKFAALTDGTDIPPPPPSPIKEEPEPIKEAAKPATEDKKELTNGSLMPNGNTTTIEAQHINGAAKNGIKRPAEDPSSPTLSSRQGSIRRLFSRNLLNTAYTNGDGEAQGTNSMDAGSMRPTSRSNQSIDASRKAKRSSGWFRRLRGEGENKRASTMFEEVKKPAGPPPPMIPELSDLEAKVDLDAKGGLGGDLFKDIK